MLTRPPLWWQHIYAIIYLMHINAYIIALINQTLGAELIWWCAPQLSGNSKNNTFAKTANDWTTSHRSQLRVNNEGNGLNMFNMATKCFVGFLFYILHSINVLINAPRLFPSLYSKYPFHLFSESIEANIHW